MITWNNLDWWFQVHVPKHKKNIMIQNFLDVLNGKASILYKIAEFSSNRIANLLASYNYS